jgi:L-seryl-tRNA(Ser) seleniumtransferase
MVQSKENIFRMLPSVESLLNRPEIQHYFDAVGRQVVADSARKAIDEIRACLAAKTSVTEESILAEVLERTEAELAAFARPHYRKVVNAAGIVLHTGLGRAVLPQKAIDQIASEMSGYSLLQLDIAEGKRSKRDAAIESLLCRLTGAEAATVVNNNAAATAIVLNTIAKDKEVIVSRGQLVEIGGAFRLPDVMAFSGAKLVEVGTTNKTHPRDYENAVTENTAAILRVHPSNYKIQGFTSEVSTAELAEIAHKHNLTTIDDVGAGALIDFSRFGFEPEPTLAQSIAAGADIVTSSADKLIGASQGGIILGKKPLIEAIRKNQFARIVRVGKLTLAALEATLKLFLDEKLALDEVPTLRMLMRAADDIKDQAQRIANAISKKAAAEVTTIPGFSQMGSGSLPTQNLATTLVAIRPKQTSAESLAKQLRAQPAPIFTRIQNDQVLIDPRTLLDGDEKLVVDALNRILAEASGNL